MRNVVHACGSLIAVLMLTIACSFFQTAFAQACVPPPSGTVSFWPGDKTANDFQGMNHGTLEGNATFATGMVGPAFSFDGASGDVVIPSINAGSAFTVEFWVYPTGFSNFDHLVSNAFGSTNYGAIYFRGSSIQYFQGNLGAIGTAAGSVPQNTWTHVALTYDGNAGAGNRFARIYVNGVLSATSADHTETFNNALKFGFSVSGTDTRFKGLLDEVSLYNQALSAADIQSIFNAGIFGKCIAPGVLVNDVAVVEGNAGTTNATFTVSALRHSNSVTVDYATADGTASAPSDYGTTSGTLIFPANSTSAIINVAVNGDTAFELDEMFFVNLTNATNASILDAQGIGTIINDDCFTPPPGMVSWWPAEGNANDIQIAANGVLENGATFAAGEVGQSFSLDGVDDSVLTPTISIGAAFTVEFWMFPTSNGGFQHMVSNGFSSANFGAIYFVASSVQYWQGGTTRVSSASGIALNTWTHVGLTYDGNVDRLYVNGTLAGTSTNHSETFNNALRFGHSVTPESAHFQGRLDEITLYSRALSGLEVQSLFSTHNTGKCSGGSWTGAVSSDWHTAGNWSSGNIPVLSSDVTLSATGVTNEPAIGSSDVTINSLTVAAGRTVTISGGRTLTINNDLTNGGAITGAGTVAFAGPALVNGGTISAANFNFNRTGAQALTGSGSFSANTAMVMAGSVLTLLSNHQLGSLVIQNGATLDITSRMLSVSGSLTNAGTFTVAGSTIMANGAAPQTLTNASYNNLTASNSSGVSLGSNATLGGTLTLTNDLSTGAFTLTMPNTASSAGAGDVLGNVRRTGFTIGTALSFGNPFNSINFTAGAPPTDVTINLVKTRPAGAIGFPTAVNRTYTITPSSVTSFTATLRLHYLDSELGANIEGGNLNLWRFTGAVWERHLVTAFDTGANWVENNGVTQLSPWTLNSTVPSAAPGEISGIVVITGGTPLEGVLVTLAGGAELRRAITNAAGAYSFINVETNGFYTVTPSRVNYNFAPSTRGFSALGAHTEASFAATFNGNHQNPLDTTEYFVRQQYVDFLGREPEEAGFNAWTDTINNCESVDPSCDRVHVSEAFFRSEEFQQRGYYVYRFYSTALGRKPGLAEFTPDMARVSGFLTNDQLEAAKTAFANDFVTRPAFAQYATMSNAQYVDALSVTAGVTLSNRQMLIDSLEAGTLTRAAALRQIAESGEVSQRYYNQAFVVMEYFGYLRRDPDALYLNWIQVLDANPADSRHMVTGFVNSAEYRQRFGS